MSVADIVTDLNIRGDTQAINWKNTKDALQQLEFLIGGGGGTEYFSAGPTTPVQGVTQAITLEWGTIAAKSLMEAAASEWSSKVWSGIGFAKVFDASFTGTSDGPLATVFNYAKADGTPYDVVASINFAEAGASTVNASVFGFNNVLTAADGATNVKFIGGEIDIQPLSGATVDSNNSGGLAVNIYNHRINYAAFFNSADGTGIYNNGILIGGTDGACLLPLLSGSIVPASFINSGFAGDGTTPISYTEAFIVAQNTAKIIFKGHSGSAPATIWQDTGNSLRIIGGATGTSIRDSTDSTSLFTVLDGGLAVFSASTTTEASLRITSGTAPTSPSDGDMWYDGANVHFRVGASTKTFTLT